MKNKDKYRITRVKITRTAVSDENNFDDNILEESINYNGF